MKTHKSFLCKIGLHKWGKATYISFSSSNVRDYKKRCQRCGKQKSWVGVKK